jgi:hypothetical protein
MENGDSGGARGDGVRASDAEREAARQRLAEHMAQGRITMDEYDERSDAILNARTRGELEAPFRDLPVQVPVTPPPAPVPLSSRVLERAAAVTGSLSVVIFLVLGLVFHAWAWAWVVFLVPGALGGWGHERGHRGRRGRWH